MNDDAIDEDDQALQKGRFYVPQVECHSRYWSNISAVKKVTQNSSVFLQMWQHHYRLLQIRVKVLKNEMRICHTTHCIEALVWKSSTP